MKRSPTCSCACKDGRPCGMKVTDGSQPPICVHHRRSLQSRSNAPLPEIDEMSILKKLARDSDPRVRLRAVDLLLTQKTSKGCPTCTAATTRGVSTAVLLDYATPEQLAALRDLCNQTAVIKDTIRAYIAAGGTPFLPPAAPVIEREPEPESDTPTPVAAEPATVQVWRDGALVEEPRADRDWQRVEDL